MFETNLQAPFQQGTTEESGHECEGGSFQWVCATAPAGAGGDGIDASIISNYIENNYGHGRAIRDEFDGLSFFD